MSNKPMVRSWVTTALLALIVLVVIAWLILG